MSMSQPSVLGIVGPTAVGKSSVAEGVALALGGEVVSVDAMQVYRGMDIGTAKTNPVKRRCALHMVDVADLEEAYSVVRFQREARACIDGLLNVGKTPVLCGGTGLYLDAVIDEMDFPAGKMGDGRRSEYERIASDRGPQCLHDLLRARDAKSADIIHPNNVRRVVRALELLDEGTSYARQHEGLKRREAHYAARLWALTLPREMLYERIDKRVNAMFEQGLVDEVRELVGRGLCENSTAGAAIGYKELIPVVEGMRDESEARLLIQRNTRRYAKRQLSWLRRDGRARCIDMSKVSLEQAIEIICDDWKAGTE